jgi:uncharacterized protein YdhG (YjbR/CyaY superfamily)
MKDRNQEITEYFSKYEPYKCERLESIRSLIHDSIPDINEKMWTKVPCFYIDKRSIVIRVFEDHINFIADTVIQYKDELSNYKITPKGMLQIYDHQELPLDTMRKIVYAWGEVAE